MSYKKRDWLAGWGARLHHATPRHAPRTPNKKTKTKIKSITCDKNAFNSSWFHAMYCAPASPLHRAVTERGPERWSETNDASPRKSPRLFGFFFLGGGCVCDDDDGGWVGSLRYGVKKREGTRPPPPQSCVADDDDGHAARQTKSKGKKKKYTHLQQTCTIQSNPQRTHARPYPSLATRCPRTWMRTPPSRM